MIIKLEVCGETCLFNCPEAVFERIGQEMGRDVQDYLNRLNQSPKVKCGGECDETYRIEEHYQRMIRDFVEDLDLLLKGKRFDREKMKAILERIRRDL